MCGRCKLTRWVWVRKILFQKSRSILLRQPLPQFVTMGVEAFHNPAGDALLISHVGFVDPKKIPALFVP